MALEAYLDIRNIKSKVTAIGSNPLRRELVLGFEDGSVETYDHETGKALKLKIILLETNSSSGERIHHCYKHKGWVTALSSLASARVFFSAGNDSTIVTYYGKVMSRKIKDFTGSFAGIGSVIDKINIGSVVYAICYHPRLKQIIFGIPQGKISRERKTFKSTITSKQQVFNCMNTIIILPMVKLFEEDH